MGVDGPRGDAPAPFRSGTTDPGRRIGASSSSRQDLILSTPSKKGRRRTLVLVALVVPALGCMTGAVGVTGMLWAMQSVETPPVPPPPPPLPTVRIPPKPERIPVEQGLRKGDELPPGPPTRPDEPSPD